MVICAIIGCSNRSGRDKVRFFGFRLLLKDKANKCVPSQKNNAVVWLARLVVIIQPSTKNNKIAVIIIIIQPSTKNCGQK